MAKASYSEGRYWCRVVSQAFGKSKNKGTPEFSLRFLVMGRINPEKPDGDLVPCDQNERTLYLYITDKTAEYVIDDLAKLGFDKSSFKFLNPSIPDFFDFTNVEFEAFCEHEEYEGEAKERWRIFKKRDHAAAAPLEDKEVRALDALFGKQLSKLTKPNGKEKEPAGELVGVSDQQRNNAGTGRADPAKAPTQDEIPF